MKILVSGYIQILRHFRSVEAITKNFWPETRLLTYASSAHQVAQSSAVRYLSKLHSWDSLKNWRVVGRACGIRIWQFVFLWIAYRYLRNAIHSHLNATSSKCRIPCGLLGPNKIHITIYFIGLAVWRSYHTKSLHLMLPWLILTQSILREAIVCSEARIEYKEVACICPMACKLAGCGWSISRFRLWYNFA